MKKGNLRCAKLALTWCKNVIVQIGGNMNNLVRKHMEREGSKFQPK